MAGKSADAFRTISEVAEWLGTPTHVLRFWESKFSQVKPVKRAGGRRYYRPADMQLLGGIKKLLHDDGMTIKGVQKLLRENGIRYVAAMSAPLDEDLEHFVEPMTPGKDAALMADAPPAPDVDVPDLPPPTGEVLPFSAARSAPVHATESRDAPTMSGETAPQDQARAAPPIDQPSAPDEQSDGTSDPPSAPAPGQSAGAQPGSQSPGSIPSDPEPDAPPETAPQSTASAPQDAPVPTAEQAPVDPADAEPPSQALPGFLRSRISLSDTPSANTEPPAAPPAPTESHEPAPAHTASEEPAEPAPEATPAPEKAPPRSAGPRFTIPAEPAPPAAGLLSLLADWTGPAPARGDLAPVVARLAALRDKMAQTNDGH